MKVAVATTIVPFIRGGGRMIVDDLVAALRNRDHEVERIEIPFWSDPATIVDQMLGLRLLDLSEAGDRLVTIRTPSQLIRHPNKVAWFIHHERSAYDLWGTKYQGLPASEEGVQIRNAIIAADDKSLREASAIYTNSKVVGERLRRYNGLGSTVLYPPLGEPEGYRCEEYGDFVFYPSRLAPIKRQDLLIEAMAHVRTPARLVVAGSPDVGPGEAKRLLALIRKLGLDDRVDLLSHWIPHAQKQDLFARALAGAYVPYDEDSYGYPSLEAFHSSKPVITCSDSGGTHELIEDRVHGLIVEPEPAALAAAIDELYENRALAERMGRAGAARLAELDISWDHVVESLLG
jgi:glycosyltransferase involved in cell wall biosynthesis